MTGLKIKLADINNNGNNTMPRGRYWESLERGARGVRAGGLACEFVRVCALVYFTMLQY